MLEIFLATLGLVLLGLTLYGVAKGIDKIASGEKPRVWTKVPEGFIIPIAKGDQIVGTIHTLPEWVEDKNLYLWHVDELKGKSPDEMAALGLRWRRKTVLGQLMGVYWMGIYPFRHRLEYKFSWNELVKTKDGKEYEIHARVDEMTSRFRFIGTYAVFIKEAETSDGFKFNATILLTFRARNVRTALRLKNWLTVAVGFAEAKFNDFSRSITVNDLLKLQTEQGEGVKRTFFETMSVLNDRANDKTNQGLVELTGNELLAANFFEYEVVGRDEERAALAAKKVAEINADAQRATSEGDRDATINRLAPFMNVGLGLAQAFLWKEGVVGTRLKAYAVGSGAGILPTLSVDDPPEPLASAQKPTSPQPATLPSSVTGSSRTDEE